MAAEQTNRVDSATMTLLKTLAVRAMSEAEYISGTHAPIKEANHANTSYTQHYGLGLEYYTHFTSPIRRYADLVVHRTLLQALLPEETQTKTLAPHKSTTVVIPSSSTTSILVDRVTTEMKQIHMASAISMTTSKNSITGFSSALLHDTCQHINLCHRNAKSVSRKCNDLYLTMYLKSRVEVATGIVSGIRRNGFLVYIPMFDIRAPVYLQDRHGNVQVDPSLLGMTLDDTLPATGGFESVPNTRILPTAMLSFNPSAETLNLDGNGRQIVFCLLDHVKVRISCDFSTVTARLPELRIHYIGHGAESDKPTVAPGAGITQMYNTIEVDEQLPPPRRIINLRGNELYEFLQRYQNRHRWSPEPLESKDLSESECPMKKIGRGRILFGGYTPPSMAYTSRHRRFMKYCFGDSKDEADREAEELHSLQTANNTSAANLTSTQLRSYQREAERRQMKLKTAKRHDRINRRNKAK